MSMPITLLYLVVASSGSYDDYSKWVVAAFPSLDAAVEFRDQASAASKECVEAYKCSPENADRKYVYFDAPTKYDLYHSVRDTEVNYRIEPLPLIQGLLPAMGLMSVTDQLASAKGVTQELNFPGSAKQFGLAAPQLAVEVKSDFADKLKAAVGTKSAHPQSGHP